MSLNTSLTHGGILRSLLIFTLPMLVGALLQQTYNLTDTWIVGRFLGTHALAAVGTSYTLLVFLISILGGLAMGSGTVVSIHYGSGNTMGLRRSFFSAFVLIGLLSLGLTLGMFAGIDRFLSLLQIPTEVYAGMRSYLWISFWGIPLVCLYNFYSAMLRAVGESLIPLYFLALSVILNVLLDLFFIRVLAWGVAGAAAATVVAQCVAAIGLGIYTYAKRPELRCTREDIGWDSACLREILSFSTLTCLQQSVMNFGILMVQGLVNSFGAVVMAAFAIAVKIDAFAYMPVQEFGNAFSTFVAQNYGACQFRRIRRATYLAFLLSGAFSLLVSVLIFVYAESLMQLFIASSESEVVQVGVQYLRIEGTFYVGIAFLFLLYGYYRAIRMPAMSVVLTILSLGTRVGLAYVLASIPEIQVQGIWWSIPIGWFIADAVGIGYYRYLSRRKGNIV